MLKSEFGMEHQEQAQYPVKELLTVPHKKDNLIVSSPAFGRNNFKNNLDAMGRTYSLNGRTFSFRKPLTSESISASAYGFGEDGEFDTKRDIFNPSWLQVGSIIKTQEGVYTNTKETNEEALKGLLNGIEKTNGIYLRDDGIAFAPYESFKRGVQSAEDFARGGLARALGHTPEEVAKNLNKIASTYKEGVDVWSFDEVQEPTLRVASLYSYRNGGRLGVDGNCRVGYSNGFTFGVLNEVPKALAINK